MGPFQSATAILVPLHEQAARVSRKLCCCGHQDRRRKIPWTLIGTLAAVLLLGVAASRTSPHPSATTPTPPQAAVILGPPPRDFTLTMGAVTWSCTMMDDVVNCVVPDVSRFRA